MNEDRKPFDTSAAFDGEFDDELPATVDRRAIERMRTVARLFDDFVRVPGTDFKVGIDPVLGVIPVVGDVISAGLSMYIVLEAARLGVSYTTLVRMIANVAIDVGGGSIPYVGGVIDAVWKANKRNLELVIEDLVEHAPEERFDEEDDAVTIEVE
ncbi:DUF4112 domain-containing protein [Haladaptatus sp. NG-WS-4]